MSELTSVREWLKKFEADGGIDNAFLHNAGVGSQLDLARQRAIDIYQSKQRNIDSSRQHEKLLKLAVETLDAQRNGNETQTKILKVLVVTIVVSILIAIFKK